MHTCEHENLAKVATCTFPPPPRVILEKSLGGAQVDIVRLGTTPLIYRARTDHAHYVTHALCAVILDFK